ncbi:hypothetical protein BM221_010052 [Beauveria bassiana]|uniref:Uncharacterized protein n=1 Tax=Beauveria bassiana TaxID=176275 RepID=A0A2N6NAF5_BEABA|nr:hypothetical protein BM221_010052 [Beauveria bassiana]
MTTPSNNNNNNVNDCQSNSNQANKTNNDGTKTLTEQIVTERTEMRRNPTENYAGGVSANMVRLSDTNPYTNERLFAAAREKKESEGTRQ